MKKLFVALLISLIIPAALTHTAEAAISDYFVDSTWLSQHLGEVTVVDVRVAPKYFLGHIDGAVHIDKKEFLSLRQGVKSLVPTTAEARILFDRYGITDAPVLRSRLRWRPRWWRSNNSGFDCEDVPSG